MVRRRNVVRRRVWLEEGVLQISTKYTRGRYEIRTNLSELRRIQVGSKRGRGYGGDGKGKGD